LNYFIYENTWSTIINFVINVKRFNPFSEVPDYFAEVIVIFSAAVVFVMLPGVVLVGNILVELVLSEKIIAYAFIILHLYKNSLPTKKKN
jgi:hypothetical protein